eukprot:418278-Alexandrium_andersonii.AAC.1
MEDLPRWSPDGICPRGPEPMVDGPCGVLGAVASCLAQPPAERRLHVRAKPVPLGRARPRLPMFHDAGTAGLGAAEHPSQSAGWSPRRRGSPRRRTLAPL